MEQTINKKRLLMFWFIFIVLYFVICTSAALFAIRAKENTLANIRRIRAQQIEKLLKKNKPKGFSENKQDDRFYESIYSQGGGINPVFKEMVTQKTEKQEEPGVRAYEQQLAEYRLKLAEERAAQLELKRKQEAEDARQRAIIEEQRQARLKQQQELEAMQLKQAAAAKAATASSAKTAQATQANSQKQEVQKTQIGKLKTSKLGESSFQNKRF